MSAMSNFLDDWFQDATDGSGRIEQHAVASLSTISAAFAALEDRIEKATEMVEQLQVALARDGWYERAETCAAILDVLNGVER